MRQRRPAAFESGLGVLVVVGLVAGHSSWVNGQLAPHLATEPHRLEATVVRTSAPWRTYARPTTDEPATIPNAFLAATMVRSISRRVCAADKNQASN